MNSNNPAARLHDLLSAWKTYGSQTTVHSALCHALELDPSGPINAVFPQLSVVMQWPAQIVGQVDGLKHVDKDLLLRWRPNVEQAFNHLPNLLSSIESVTPFYNVQNLADLEHCASALSFQTPEPTLSPESLADLGNLIRQAIEAVVADISLPEQARHWLVARLRDVEQAVLHFRIAGYAGVQEAMERLIGGVATRPDTQTAEATSWIKQLWSKIMASQSDIQKLAATTHTVSGAIEAGQNLINGS